MPPFNLHRNTKAREGEEFLSRKRRMQPTDAYFIHSRIRDKSPLDERITRRSKFHISPQKRFFIIIPRYSPVLNQKWQKEIEFTLCFVQIILRIRVKIVTPFSTRTLFRHTAPKNIDNKIVLKNKVR